MANNKSLDRALGETLSDIRTSLADKLRKLLEKNTEDIRKEEGLLKLIKKKDELENLKAEERDAHYKRERVLDEQINALEREIDTRDGFTTKEKEALSEEECKLIDVVNNGYHKAKSQIKAMKKALNTSEARNYLNFLKLETNTRTMYDLAITAKEKRNIIFSIQTRDWRSVGVEIPQLPHLERFEIQDGEIKLPTQLLLESSK
jgi:hypothetical protein